MSSEMQRRILDSSFWSGESWSARISMAGIAVEVGTQGTLLLLPVRWASKWTLQHGNPLIGVSLDLRLQRRLCPRAHAA